MLREKLAELAHSQWSGWMEYLFSKGEFNGDGTWIMPAWAVKRWTNQMKTSYVQLSDDEQESDRKEADRFLEVIDLYQGNNVVDRVSIADVKMGLGHGDVY